MVIRPSGARLSAAAAGVVTYLLAVSLAGGASALVRGGAIAVGALVTFGIVAAATTSVTVTDDAVVVRRLGTVRRIAPGSADVACLPVFDGLACSRVALVVRTSCGRTVVTVPLDYFSRASVDRLRAWCAAPARAGETPLAERAVSRS